MAAVIHDFKVFEDSGAMLMARIAGNDAANILQADITSIAYSVYDEDDLSTPTTGTLDKTVVIFDTLQTDDRWTEDSTGYNFRWDAPASLFAAGTKRYRLEISFTPVSGEVFHLVYRGTVTNLYRS